MTTVCPPTTEAASFFFFLPPILTGSPAWPFGVDLGVSRLGLSSPNCSRAGVDFSEWSAADAVVGVLRAVAGVVDFCLVAHTFVGGVGAALGMAGVTGAVVSFVVVVEGFSSAFSLILTLSFASDPFSPIPFSLAAAVVDRADETCVSVDG